MNRNISVNVVPSYEEYLKERYISYLETLGENIIFDDDKWVCDKKKKRLSETNLNVTIYFSKVRREYKEMIKLFAIIRIMSNASIAVVKNDIFRISEYLDFVNGNLDVSYESAMRYKQYLDMTGLSETTLHSKWGSVNKFYEIMNGYENKKYQMCFANNPYDSHKKHDYKYIPDTVAQQLDRVFYYEDVDETIRCVYWILRLVPSRISEVLNIKIDCLKPFDGHYCLFIPTWKQNGGRREPIMRCIHIENEGMGGYLISLIHKQQNMSKELQKFMPENKKDALFTYRTVNHMPDGTKNMTNQYRVVSWPVISRKFEKICEKYSIRNELGEIYKVTTHQFRHNGITDRLEKGFTVEQVTDITGHHGSTMLLDAYSHLNLKPETILKVQNSVISEIEKDYTAFNGQVMNCSQEQEDIIMKNVRAHKVRGGICRDITGCKSDMMNCLECQYFKPDSEQLEYYKEQLELWEQKAEKFKAMPMIRANAERNIKLLRRVVDILKK
ncbi:MAG: site-specific integrase [Tyzzerella sp.]|nr:site-specific integrase [Tyzzerella sp.]